MSFQLEKYCRKLDGKVPSVSSLVRTIDHWGEELIQGGIYPILQGFWCSRFHPKEDLKSDCEECIRLRHLSEVSEDLRVVEVYTTPSGYKTGRYLYLDLFTLRYLIERYLKKPGVETHLRGYLCGRVGHLIYPPTRDSSPRISLSNIRKVYRDLIPSHYSFASLDLSYRTNPFQINLPSHSGITIASTRLLPYRNPPSYYPEEIVVLKEDYFYLRTSHRLQADTLISQRLRGELNPVLDANLNLLITGIVLREHLSDSDWNQLWIDPPPRSEFNLPTDEEGGERFRDLFLQLNQRPLKYIYRL